MIAESLVRIRPQIRFSSVVPGEDEGDQTREGMTGHCFQTGATQLGTSSLADVTGLKPQYVYTRVRNLVLE